MSGRSSARNRRQHAEREYVGAKILVTAGLSASPPSPGRTSLLPGLAIFAIVLALAWWATLCATCWIRARR
jgi:hypothetical protein